MASAVLNIFVVVVTKTFLCSRTKFLANNFIVEVLPPAPDTEIIS